MTKTTPKGRPAIRWISHYHARGLQSQKFNNIVGKPLTDRKIAKYEAQGYYSAAVRQARRERREAAQKARAKRVGSFLEVEGRLIYSPV